MLKKVIVFLLVVSMLVSFGGCANSNSNSGTKVDKIKSAGKIVLGTAADYPPYEFHKIINGKDEIVGFDIEIAKEIAKDLGVELEIIDMKFEGLLPALVTNDVDFVIAGMSADEERSKTVDFSKSYYESVHRLVVRKDDSDKLHGPEDFPGLKIGAQKSSLQEGIVVEQFDDAEKILLANITDLILELKSKKIDGVVLAESVAQAYVNQNPDLVLTEMVLAKEEGVAVALNKGNPELLDAINVTLDRLMSEGLIDKFIDEATKLAGEE